MAETGVRLKGERPPKANTTSGTHEAAVELILRHGGGSVLDAPCGEGALAWQLAQRGC